MDDYIEFETTEGKVCIDLYSIYGFKEIYKGTQILIQHGNIEVLEPYDKVLRLYQHYLKWDKTRYEALSKL